MTAEPQTSFGPYRVKSRIGKGGMGDVYLAEDPRLQRDVAIKTLPESHALDPARRARFLTEARAASALHHPHIVTIFDLGSHGGTDFIVMEFVDGKTVREMLANRRPDVRTALEIAAQVANGLAAAHAAGIVHRDLKPENLIVGNGGRVKILDYGVAKLLSTSAETGESETTAVARHLTEPGMMVGTLTYMAPEQIDGRAVDARTDIFALGIVLGEMLSGRNPVAGATTADTLQKIMNAPPPADRIGRDLPPRVMEIVQRALAANPAERYQHAGDLELDLRRAMATLNEQPVAATRPGRIAPWLIASAAAGLLAGGVTGFIAARRTTSAAPPAPPRLTFTPLTSDPGYEGEPTFSPDGRSIVYVSDRTGNLDLFLKQVAGGPDLNLTNDPADDAQPSFSPDGKSIAFVSTRASAAPLIYRAPDVPAMGGDIWIMSALGGVPRRIAQDGNFPSWSPDGASVVFTRGPWQQQKIFRVSTSDGGAAALNVEMPTTPLFIHNPRYSPDGTWLTFATTQPDNVWIVEGQGGRARSLGPGQSPSWQDASTIVYSDRAPGRNSTLSRVRIDRHGEPVEEVEPLTSGRGSDRDAVVSADGTVMAFAAQTIAFNIERVPFDGVQGKVTGPPEAITLGNGKNPFFSVSPDGRSVVFQSERNAKRKLWRKDLDTGAVTQLTLDERFSEAQPRWSPDGKFIAFVRNDGDTYSLMIMNNDGANVRKLLAGRGFLAWSRDSRALAFFSFSERQICTYELATGRVRAVTKEATVRTMQNFSSGGKWIVYQAHGATMSTDVRVVPVSGGPSMVIADSPQEEMHPFFAPDDRWLYYQLGHKNLVRVPGPEQQWRKAPPQQVTFFAESNLFLDDPQLTLDGRYLFYSRRSASSDVWIAGFEHPRRDLTSRRSE